jgi:hypothetical protein
MMALDYRENPSATADEAMTIAATGRDNPNPGGRFVAPWPDRTIMCYDLPTELMSYDRTRAGAPDGNGG